MRFIKLSTGRLVTASEFKRIHKNILFNGPTPSDAVLASVGAEWGPSMSVPQDIRDERDRLLAASDWTQVADAPVDQAAWATYRQALRDVPQQAGFPEDVVWPEEPNG